MLKTNKIFFALAIINIALLLFYAISFLYFNKEYISIFILNIGINIVLGFLMIKIILSKKFIVTSLLLIACALFLTEKNNNNIEHIDVYASIISKVEMNNQKYMIKIENFGDLSNEPISLEVSKHDYEKLSVDNKKYLITYRNYNINELTNISKLETIHWDE
ncbi:hypothetical protein [Enterococcus sp. RIT-PI-f]|uniref:hypothetical protein n=1 Tax=Enterococcus sp. RIT-PI-f TaxID=1690244 RepID=UPI0006B99A08|nr:hypothetical protein [Enterococcus sp. RIT-PI-f]KPG70651.1 hypothetical protein AEQ18_08835 [Enterococcus sp. RIT-PI-f]